MKVRPCAAPAVVIFHFSAGLRLFARVGDRCNCEFWPPRVPTYPPPPALNSESARPPGGRSGTCLPLRGACLPRDHTYLPSRRFFQLQRSPTTQRRFFLNRQSPTLCDASPSESVTKRIASSGKRICRDVPSGWGGVVQPYRMSFVGREVKAPYQFTVLAGLGARRTRLPGLRAGCSTRS